MGTANQSLSVLCATSVSGKPTPTVIWKDHRGTILENDTNHVLINDASGIRLNIASLDGNEGFFYTCVLKVEAENVTIQDGVVPYYVLGGKRHSIRVFRMTSKQLMLKMVLCLVCNYIYVGDTVGFTVISNPNNYTVIRGREGERVAIQCAIFEENAQIKTQWVLYNNTNSEILPFPDNTTFTGNFSSEIIFEKFGAALHGHTISCTSFIASLSVFIPGSEFFLEVYRKKQLLPHKNHP